jgi:DNA-binding FadR family transcriptional regulator
MLLDPVRLAEHLHGHLGWLAAASLLHPAIVLRNRTRRAHLAVFFSTGLVTVAAGIGLWIYAFYRERLKQGIFLQAPSVGFLFERKEHLAFGAVMLAWAGAAAYLAARRATSGARERLRTVAFHSFCASAALAVVVAILGTVVATYRGF